jgi:hypothetical protein
MQLPTGQLDTLRTDAATLLAGCAAAGSPAGENDSGTSLPMLEEAFDQLIGVLARAESDLQSGGSTGTAGVTELGEYALQLVDNLAVRIGQTGDDSLRQAQAALTINLALWIARHGGVIDTPEAVVDALALFANTTTDTHALAGLYAIISTIISAMSPVISQDLEKINPGRPWRVLLLNQSIVATRSHNTELMEEAFALLTESLPADAGHFFTEGMQQMDALNYPGHVREVMARYHRQWNVDRSLH